MKSRVVLFLAFVLAGGAFTPMRAQPAPTQFRIYLTQLDSGAGTLPFRAARFGVHPDALFNYDGTGRVTDPNVHQYATRGYADHWFENETDSTYELDDFPSCAFAVEIRLNNNRAPLLNPGSDGQYVNIHPFVSRTQVDTFKVIWCTNDGLRSGSYRPQIFTWPSVLSSYCDSMKWILRSRFPRDTVNMLTHSSWTMHPETDVDALGNPITFALIVMYGPKVPPGAPATVTLVSPPNGSDVQPANISLQWASVPGADYYKVEVSIDSSFSGPFIYVDSVTTTSVTLPALHPSADYYWRVLVSNPFGVSYYQNPPNSFHVSTSSGVGPEGQNNPRTFALYPNYPNPFNPKTDIRYSIGGVSHVTLKVLDVLGREMATLVNENEAPGEYTVSWDAGNLSNGVYFYKLEASGSAPDRASGFLAIKTMILMK
jgi:hypothetical protein